MKLDESLKIAKKSSKKVGELLSRTKDQTKDSEKSEVIYRFACGDCELPYSGPCLKRLKDNMVSHELSHSPKFNRFKILNWENIG